MNYNLVLFDIDGTLINTSEGIINSVRFSIEKMGFVPIDLEKMKSFIGPPPKLMYKKIFGCSDDEANKATFFHRQYGNSKGLFESTPYNGMIDILQTLKKAGIKLGIATLKQQFTAETILKYHNLFDFFDVVVGMNLDENLTKADTIAQAMKKIGVFEKVLMIGDSQYDLEGAEKTNVDFLGVTYGFGFKPNINYSFKKVDTPNEIIKYLTN